MVGGLGWFGWFRFEGEEVFEEAEDDFFDVHFFLKVV